MEEIESAMLRWAPMALTLLTDFGQQDPYVGSMKGVIARIAPQVTVIDLTHQIPPQNLVAARFCLMSAFRDFPIGSIHVAVVDPGVGSSRRGVAIQIAEGFLVGPDNGLFSGVLAQSPALAVMELTRPDRWRIPNPSPTFHGRDIFAPVGAHLANGTPLDQVGDPIDTASLVSLPIPSCQPIPNGIRGTIQYCDRFGNAITTIPGTYVAGQGWQVQAGDSLIPWGQTFSSVPIGQAIGLVGSHGWVEIAINQGNARERLGLDIGDTIAVVRHP